MHLPVEPGRLIEDALYTVHSLSPCYGLLTC